MLAADIGRVMLAGDWERPEMPAYYGRKLAPDLSGVAELSRQQNRSSEGISQASGDGEVVSDEGEKA